MNMTVKNLARHTLIEMSKARPRVGRVALVRTTPGCRNPSVGNLVYEYYPSLDGIRLTINGVREYSTRAEAFEVACNFKREILKAMKEMEHAKEAA